MPQDSLIAEIDIEALDPADLASAAQDCDEKLSTNVCHLDKIGLGFEAFLRWSLEDIQAAGQAPAGDTQSRFAANALINARRALSCIVDQYLLRDGFACCSDAPQGAQAKADLLVKRGIFDDLASRALKRAVDRRHKIEHQYLNPLLDEAQDTVQMVRATIETAVAKSDPYSSPAFYGTILGGHASSPTGTAHWFAGWSGALYLTVVPTGEPWIGVVIPSSKTKATLRKVALKKVTCAELQDFRSALEPHVTGLGSGTGPATLKQQLECCGIWQ